MSDTTPLSTQENFGYFDKFVCDLRFFARCLVRALPYDRLQGETELRSKMIAHFVSRGDACLGSIYLLCKNYMYSDARILERTLVDLVVHMKYVLIDRRDVEGFWHHTVTQRARFANDALSNSKIRDDMYKQAEKDAKLWQNTERKLRSERGKCEWVKPDAHKVLRGNEHYKQIYRYGYDATSATLIHPVLNTGLSDYSELIGHSDKLRVQASYEVMSNATVEQILLMHMAVGFYNSKARRIASDCLITMIGCLREESYEYDDKVVAFSQRVGGR